MAQGIANIVAPFFGGIPATGAIARTATNVRAGASTPVAGMIHALTLLVIVLVAAPLATYIPLAVLAAVLLFVAWNMGDWNAFRRIERLRLEQRIKLFGTFLLTVIVDLTVAIEVGLVARLPLLRLPHERAVPGRARRRPRRVAPGVVAYRLYGPLFFGAVAKLEALPDSCRRARRRSCSTRTSCSRSTLPASMPSRTCTGRWRGPASGWSSSASTSSRSRRCASGASTPRSAPRTCSSTATAPSRRWSRPRRSRSTAPDGRVATPGRRARRPGRLDSLRPSATMPLFWKPYKSEVSSFIDDLKAKKPTLEAEQRAGRALLWDKQIDRELQSEYQEAKVPQQPYVYQTHVK